MLGNVQLADFQQSDFQSRIPLVYRTDRLHISFAIRWWKFEKIFEYFSALLLLARIKPQSYREKYISGWFFAIYTKAMQHLKRQFETHRCYSRQYIGIECGKQNINLIQHLPSPAVNRTSTLTELNPDYNSSRNIRWAWTRALWNTQAQRITKKDESHSDE